MKKILFFCFTLIVTVALFFTGSSAYDQNDVDKVYRYLVKKWSYYDINGNKISVTRMSRRMSGTDHEIIINGKSLDPSTVYDASGANVLDPSKRGLAKPKEIKGNEKGNMKGITEAHNKFRRMTGGGLPELVWDEEIASYAQQWAEHLKANNGCSMEHRRGSYRVKRYGENLAWASGKELEADEVVQMWYDEIKDYNYASNSCSGVCGHYTQVVWRDSKKVGCGMAKCGRSEVWVCNYDPPGNWVGKKPY